MGALAPHGSTRPGGDDGWAYETWATALDGRPHHFVLSVPADGWPTLYVDGSPVQWAGVAATYRRALPPEEIERSFQFMRDVRG